MEMLGKLAAKERTLGGGWELARGHHPSSIEPIIRTLVKPGLAARSIGWETQRAWAPARIVDAW